MSMASIDPEVLARDLLPSVIKNNNAKPLGENDNQRDEIQDNENMSLTISDEFIGDTEANLAAVISRYVDTLTHHNTHFLGYPNNLDFNYDALAQLHVLIPHKKCRRSVYREQPRAQFKEFELWVIEWFARLWEIEKNEYWGYITTCGAEGNRYGI